MIIALAHVERERNASFLAGFFQQPRTQAVVQETVCGALIDQAQTVRDGFAYAFTIRDAGFLPTLDQTDLASVRSMLESMTFPSSPITSP